MVVAIFLVCPVSVLHDGNSPPSLPPYAPGSGYRAADPSLDEAIYSWLGGGLADYFNIYSVANLTTTLGYNPAADMPMHELSQQLERDDIAVPLHRLSLLLWQSAKADGFVHGTQLYEWTTPEFSVIRADGNQTLVMLKDFHVHLSILFPPILSPPPYPPAIPHPPHPLAPPIMPTYEVQVERRRWEDARQHCIQLGGKLAEPRSAVEQDMVRRAAQAAGRPYLWLGGSEHGSPGTWVWANDSVPFWWGMSAALGGYANEGAYTNWRPGNANRCPPINCGEPNSAVTDVQCLQLHDNGYWDDTDCSILRESVCELPPPLPPTPPSAPPLPPSTPPPPPTSPPDHPPPPSSPLPHHLCTQCGNASALAGLAPRIRNTSATVVGTCEQETDEGLHGIGGSHNGITSGVQCYMMGGAQWRVWTCQQVRLPGSNLRSRSAGVELETRLSWLRA